MNPYAAHLGERDPLAVIAATPSRIEGLMETLGPERGGRAPAPGKWSAREIVCHLADCELVFAYRLRQTLAEDRHVIQPFNQDHWAKQYSAYDASAALMVFAAMRRWNLALIRSLPAPAMAKTATHPERGDMTFRTIIETMAGHDLNHLKQIQGLA